MSTLDDWIANGDGAAQGAPEAAPSALNAWVQGGDAGGAAKVPEAPQRSIAGNLGLGLRSAVEGMAGLPAMALDAATAPGRAMQRGLGMQEGTAPSAMLHGALDGAGLPKPATLNEQRTDRMVQTLAGIVPTMGVGAAAGIPSLLARPGMQAASALTGGAASQAADEAGYGAVGQTVAGMAGGLAVPAGAAAAGRVIQPVRNQLTPEAQRLAQQAAAEGIPLTAGQQTGSKPLKIAESVFEQLPLTSGPQAAVRQAQQTAFNRASLSRSGVSADVATPDVLNEARNRIGGQFNDLTARNDLHVDGNLMQQLTNHLGQAEQLSIEQVGRPVRARIEQMFDHMQPGDTVPGPYYRQMDSELGRTIRETSNGDLRGSLGRLRDTLREGMDRSISPEDAAAWSQARREYANLMVTAKAAGGAGAGAAEGNVSPLALRGAVDRSTGGGYAFGQGDQNDLARIGQTFLRAPPDSGTAGRTAMTSLLQGGGIGGAAAMSGASPIGAVASGAAATLGPRMAQMLMNSDAGQAYLTNGIPGLNRLTQGGGALAGGNMGDMMAQRLLQGTAQQQAGPNR